MSNKFTAMDGWTSEQVAQFKENIPTIKAPAAQHEAFLLEAITRPEVLVAEGDSWFDYLPGTDIINCLQRYYGYSIHSYAKAGDTLENMIYGTNINKHFERISPSINTVLSRLGEEKPKIFLFSGGGNDIAGDEFESYLNHKDSGLHTVRVKGARVGFVSNLLQNNVTLAPFALNFFVT